MRRSKASSATVLTYFPDVDTRRSTYPPWSVLPPMPEGGPHQREPAEHQQEAAGRRRAFQRNEARQPEPVERARKQQDAQVKAAPDALGAVSQPPSWRDASQATAN